MKMTLKLLHKALALLVFAFTIGAGAQEIEVSGTVSDTGGIPIPGANVIIQGTQTGTASDFDGNYTISVSPGQILVFSSIGFKTVER